MLLVQVSTTVVVKRTKRFERCALMFPGLANSYMTLSTPDTGRRSVMTMLLHKSGKKTLNDTTITDEVT